MFQASENKAVREQAFFLSMLGSGGTGAGVLRVAMDADPGIPQSEAVLLLLLLYSHYRS